LRYTLTHQNLPLLLALAALSFVPTLFFYYVGEEAIHPIVAMEMWHQGEWLKQPLYGADIRHIPLYNWLIIAAANVVGWPHVLEVARGITIVATLSGAGVLAWFAQRLFGDRRFALFAALAYLTLADVLLYRGWLAYVDPLFALCVFASLALLVVAAREQHYGLLVLAATALTLAFMSKALTAYVFYGAAGFVLLWDKTQRKFLLGAASLALHGGILAIPWAWSTFVGSRGHSGRMFEEIVAKLSVAGLLPYLEKILLFPLETLLRFSPVLLLAIYFWWRKRIRQPETEPLLFKTLGAIALLNFLPYWFAPQSNIRYVLPLAPLIALLAARLIWRAGEAGQRLALQWFAAIIAFKFIFALALFPYYQREFRGENYWLTAKEIMLKTHGQPLYVTDVSASGLSVAGYIDTLRHPQQPLQWPPAQWESGFVMAYTPDAALGEVHKIYTMGGDKLYLLCRGEACR